MTEAQDTKGSFADRVLGKANFKKAIGVGNGNSASLSRVCYL